MTTRVLLVEDDERIRQALGLALADEGYAVLETATGEEALEAADADLDVVLLDHHPARARPAAAVERRPPRSGWAPPLPKGRADLPSSSRGTTIPPP